MAVKMSRAGCANIAARHFVGFTLPAEIVVKFAMIVPNLARRRLPPGISIATEL
jgi:hypothetical protein